MTSRKSSLGDLGCWIHSSALQVFRYLGRPPTWAEEAVLPLLKGFAGCREQYAVQGQHS